MRREDALARSTQQSHRRSLPRFVCFLYSGHDQRTALAEEKTQPSSPHISLKSPRCCALERPSVLGDLEALTNFCDSNIGLAAQGTDIVNRKITFDLPDKMASPACFAVIVKQNQL
jgi:hypothetical protein